MYRENNDMISISITGSRKPIGSINCRAGNLAFCLAVSLILLLQGCQTMETQAPDPAQTLAVFRTRSFSDLEVTEALQSAGLPVPSPQDNWTEAHLIAVAQAMNPSLKVATAEQRSRESAIDVAKAPNPIGIALDLQRAASGSSPWTTGFSLSALIQTADKRGIQTRRAQSEYNRAVLETTQLRWQVRSAVAHALLDCQITGNRMELLGEMIGDYRQLSTLQMQREAIGEGNHFDSILAQQELASLNAQIADANKQHTAALSALATAVGMPVEALQTLNLAPWSPISTTLTPTSFDLLLEQAAIEHPAVLQALNDYVIQESNLRLALAGQYPDLQLGPGYTYDQGQHKWLLGLGITVPLDGNRPAIQQAVADLKRSEASFEATQESVIQDLQSSWTAYGESRRILLEMEKLQAQNVQIASAQQRRFEVGESDRFALIRNHIQSLQGELSLAEATQQVDSHLLRLQDALCSPIHTHPTF